MKPDELRRYAELIVRGCIAFRRGDTLLERSASPIASSPSRSPRPPTARARSAVDVEYEDSRVYAARIRHASKRRARPPHLVAGRAHARARRRDVAIVQVDGRVRADVLADLPPERVAEDRSGSRQTPRRAHPPRRPAARDDLRLADGRVGRAGLPGPGRRRRSESSRRTCSGSAGSARRTRRATRAGRSTSPRCAAGRPG